MQYQVDDKKHLYWEFSVGFLALAIKPHEVRQSGVWRVVDTSQNVWPVGVVWSFGVSDVIFFPGRGADGADDSYGNRFFVTARRSKIFGYAFSAAVDSFNNK